MISGLSSKQVRQAIERGEVNTAAAKTTKSISAIIRDNVLSLFNLINIILFVLLIITKSYKNTLFIFIMISNTLISIIQEIRAKKVVDRLNVLSAITATVIRDGKEQTIPIEEMVLGDVFIISPGSQICVDAELLSSDNLELDESMLTGESRAVKKIAGNSVLSGSYAISGRGIAKATAVGASCYAQQLTKEARKHKRAHSEIFSSLRRIIKYVTVFLIPAGIILFVSQYFRSDISIPDTIAATAGALIGMIPNGLMLLTSISFAAGVIKLATQKTIVREFAGMETLARIDTLCLDKTGTLTEGRLAVIECIEYNSSYYEAACAMSGAFPDKNHTAQALSAYFPPGNYTPVENIPFSSDRKYSAARFENLGWIAQGAPDVLLKDNTDILNAASKYANEGKRVILIASSDMSPEDEKAKFTPLALIILSDVLRPAAAKTLKYFKEQDISIKIISGDDPRTVSNIAAQLSLDNADKYVDASKLTDDELKNAAETITVFGRVTPEQKKLLIETLKENGHNVAMTGDGTNDVPALRAADCSIAMASGTDAAKGVGHVVLVDSDFSHLPAVLGEGRRVIGNIERVSSLFLVKTTFSMILTLFSILSGMAYPFFPIHMTVVSATAVGIPSFFYALAPNKSRATPGFLHKVIKNAIPSGICIALSAIIIQILAKPLGLSTDQSRFICFIIAELISFMTLIIVSKPFNPMRICVIAASAVLFVAITSVFPNLLELTIPSLRIWLIVTITAAVNIIVLFVLRKIISKLKFWK